MPGQIHGSLDHRVIKEGSSSPSGKSVNFVLDAVAVVVTLLQSHRLSTLISHVVYGLITVTSQRYKERFPQIGKYTCHQSVGVR